jgi:hypothetical protein
MIDTNPSQVLEIRRSEDFCAAYANNVQIHPTAWDLRMTFGELGIDGDKQYVDQHTQITMSWPEVKLFIYLLRTNLFAFEMQNGRVTVVDTGLPVDAPPIPDEIKNDSAGMKMIEGLEKLRVELLASARRSS